MYLTRIFHTFTLLNLIPLLTRNEKNTELNNSSRHAKELVVHTGNHQACIDNVRNIWEIFEPRVNTLSFPIFLAEQEMTEGGKFFARLISVYILMNREIK
jgi:hypothetical protein